MSGGGGSSAILPAVGAGLGIASLIATGGADAPLVATEEGALLEGGAATYDAGLSADAMASYGGGASGLPSLSQAATGVSALNSANNAANAFSPQELQAIRQGQQDSFIQNPNQYYSTASTDANAPLVPVNPVQNVPTSTVADTSVAQNVQNEAAQAPVTTPTVPPQPTSGAYAGYTPQQWATATQGMSAQDMQNATNAPGATTPWYQQYWNNLTDTSGKGLNFAQGATLGGAGIATLLALQKSGAMKPNYLPQYNPVSASSVGLGRTLSPNYQPNRASQWGYATGGNVSTPANVAPADLQKNPLEETLNKYGITPQVASQGLQSLMGNQPMPTAGASFSTGGVPHLKEGSFVVPADVVSHFGNGSTDAGLASLRKHLGAEPIMGHGDGMSDDIATTIEGKQPARVANGEAVVNPDKVKALGNGSTDAGAKKLYAMMNKVRKARTGTTKQGKQIKAEKYLPA